MAWQQDVLAWIQAPNTGGNVAALSLWAQSEGMPGYVYNWLATTEDWPGATLWNSDGVKIYASYLDGVAATGTTILQYDQITAGFRENIGDQFQLWDYINKSSWCAGCQNGHYPDAFYKYLQGTGGIEEGVGGGGPAIPTVDLGTLAADVRTAWDDLRQFYNLGWLDNLTGLTWIKDAIDQL